MDKNIQQKSLLIEEMLKSIDLTLKIIDKME